MKRTEVAVCYGLCIGLAFGFAMEKGKIFLPYTIREQMLMRCFLMFKMFLTATAVSSIITVVFDYLGIVVRVAKAQALGFGIFKGHGGNIVGGLILGAGISLSGACPGTVMAQLGVGVPSATYVVAGCIISAFTFGFIHKHLVSVTKGAFLKREDSMLLDKYLGQSVLITAMITTSVMISAVWMLEKLSPSSVEHSKIVGSSSIQSEQWLDPFATVWSPVICGIVIGCLQIPSILLLGTHLAASSSYVTVVAHLYNLFDPDSKKNVPYFANFYTWSDYGVVGSVIGTAIGACLSSYLSGTKIPADMSGTSNFTYFVGGYLLLLGARIAGGCPSGHGLSGMSRLSVASAISVMCMFGGGIATSLLIYN